MENENARVTVKYGIDIATVPLVGMTVDSAIEVVSDRHFSLPENVTVRINGTEIPSDRYSVTRLVAGDELTFVKVAGVKGY